MAQHMAVAGKSHTVNPGNHVLRAEHVCVWVLLSSRIPSYMRYGALHLMKDESMYFLLKYLYKRIYNN